MTHARAAVALASAATAAMLMISTASAHARLKTSTPAIGEVVQSSPAKVDIFFTQDIQKVAGTYSIEVERDRGATVSPGDATIDESDRTHVSVALQPNLTPGRYVVHWTNVSDDDGDPAEGAFSFYVQTQPNTVDLANDAQLATIGAEEEATGTPGADGTSTVGSGAISTPATSATASGTRPAPAASPTAAATSSDDGDSNTGLWVAIGIIAAVAIVGGAGALVYFQRQRTRP